MPPDFISWITKDGRVSFWVRAPSEAHNLAPQVSEAQTLAPLATGRAEETLSSKTVPEAWDVPWKLPLPTISEEAPDESKVQATDALPEGAPIGTTSLSKLFQHQQHHHQQKWPEAKAAGGETKVSALSGAPRRNQPSWYDLTEEWDRSDEARELDCGRQAQPHANNVEADVKEAEKRKRGRRRSGRDNRQ